MLDHVAKLVQQPAAMTAADVDRLRHHGFDDAAVLEVTLVTGYMSFVNRVADGLGVELEPTFSAFRR